MLQQINVYVRNTPTSKSTMARPIKPTTNLNVEAVPSKMPPEILLRNQTVRRMCRFVVLLKDATELHFEILSIIVEDDRSQTKYVPARIKDDVSITATIQPTAALLAVLQQMEDPNNGGGERVDTSNLPNLHKMDPHIDKIRCYLEWAREAEKAMESECTKWLNELWAALKAVNRIVLMSRLWAREMAGCSETYSTRTFNWIATEYKNIQLIGSGNVLRAVALKQPKLADGEPIFPNPRKILELRDKANKGDDEKTDGKSSIDTFQGVSENPSGSQVKPGADGNQDVKKKKKKESGPKSRAGTFKKEETFNSDKTEPLDPQDAPGSPDPEKPNHTVLSVETNTGLPLAIEETLVKFLNGTLSSMQILKMMQDDEDDTDDDDAEEPSSSGKKQKFYRADSNTKYTVKNATGGDDQENMRQEAAGNTDGAASDQNEVGAPGMEIISSNGVEMLKVQLPPDMIVEDVVPEYKAVKEKSAMQKAANPKKTEANSETDDVDQSKPTPASTSASSSTRALDYEGAFVALGETDKEDPKVPGSTPIMSEADMSPTIEEKVNAALSYSNSWKPTSKKEIEKLPVLLVGGSLEDNVLVFTDGNATLLTPYKLNKGNGTNKSGPTDTQDHGNYQHPENKITEKVGQEIASKSIEKDKHAKSTAAKESKAEKGSATNVKAENDKKNDGMKDHDVDPSQKTAEQAVRKVAAVVSGFIYAYKDASGA